MVSLAEQELTRSDQASDPGEELIRGLVATMLDGYDERKAVLILDQLIERLGPGKAAEVIIEELHPS